MTLPPGSRLPAPAQTLRLLRTPIEFLEGCRARYGRIFRAKIIGYPRLVYVADRELARRVFDTDRDIGRAGEVRREVMEPLVGRSSVLCLEGDEWLRQRKLLGPPLHGRVVESYRDEIARIAADEIGTWPQARPFALRPRMQAITLEVILRVVFGIRDAGRLRRLRELLPELIEAGMAAIVFGLLPLNSERVLNSRLLASIPASPLRRFWRLRAEADALIYDEIERRRAEPDGEAADVLSLLLEARDPEGRPMSNEELRDELVTLLEAGHETTATALAWTFERLVRSPTVMARLREALDGGDEKYLDAVVKESLRTRPIVLDTPRLLDSTLDLDGYQIPEGWYVAPAIPLVHTDPDLYPDAAEFRPERFLEERIAPDAWIPFGGGRRRCIGSHMAMLEMKTVIAEVVDRVELHPAEPEPERARVHHVTLVPEKGTRVVAEPQPAPATRPRRAAASGVA